MTDWVRRIEGKRRSPKRMLLTDRRLPRLLRPSNSHFGRIAAFRVHPLGCRDAQDTISTAEDTLKGGHQTQNENPWLRPPWKVLAKFARLSHTSHYAYRSEPYHRARHDY